jgi:hypothetical protein
VAILFSLVGTEDSCRSDMRGFTISSEMIESSMMTVNAFKLG